MEAINEYKMNETFDFVSMTFAANNINQFDY